MAVDPQGRTVETPEGRAVRVATEWVGEAAGHNAPGLRRLSEALVASLLRPSTFYTALEI